MADVSGGRIRKRSEAVIPNISAGKPSGVGPAEATHRPACTDRYGCPNCQRPLAPSAPDGWFCQFCNITAHYGSVGDTTDECPHETVHGPTPTGTWICNQCGSEVTPQPTDESKRVLRLAGSGHSGRSDLSELISKHGLAALTHEPDGGFSSQQPPPSGPDFVGAVQLVRELANNLRHAPREFVHAETVADNIISVLDAKGCP